MPAAFSACRPPKRANRTTGFAPVQTPWYDGRIMAKQDIDTRAEDALDENSSDPRVYELGFHLDPNLPTEGVKRAYEEVRSLVAGKGTIVAEGEPQKIPLAYTISRMETGGRRDFESAYFSWIVYETLPEAHGEVIATAAGNKNIIRFIDLLTTKEAARHASEMRELALKQPDPDAEEREDAIGAELDAALENAAV